MYEEAEVNRSDFLTLSRGKNRDEDLISTSNEQPQNNFLDNNLEENDMNRAGSHNFFPSDKIPGSAQIGHLPLHKVSIHDSMKKSNDKRCSSQLG
jgi:hypothetical protein